MTGKIKLPKWINHCLLARLRLSSLLQLSTEGQKSFGSNYDQSNPFH
jgi:hypothetical protein